MATIAFDRVGQFAISTIYTFETWTGEPRYETAVFDESKVTHLTDNNGDVMFSVSEVVAEYDYTTEEEALANHRKLVDHYSTSL